LQRVKNNYQTIEQEFNWNKINGEYLQIFQQCMERPKNGKRNK
jgi:hypothetical protein